MSYQTYTDIYAYPSQNKSKEIMDRIRAALEEHDFFISEETFVDHAELVHFHCADSNKDASDYTDILAPIADEYDIDIHVLYQSDYSDVVTDQLFVGPNATELYAKHQLAKIKEIAVHLLRTYDHSLLSDIAASEGFVATSVLNLLSDISPTQLN